MVNTSGIITKEDVEKVQMLYNNQQAKIARKLKAIKEGQNFGYEDPWDNSDYFPGTFVKVIDEEKGIIEFTENNLTHQESVLDLFVEGEN